MAQKLTRKAIADFVLWTSSRWNTWKKGDVVKIAYEMMTPEGHWRAVWPENANPGAELRANHRPASGWEQRITEMHFHCGVFSDQSITHASGIAFSDYLVDAVTRTIRRGTMSDSGVFTEHSRIEFE